MRQIRRHHTNDANRQITITCDERGQGNMSHRYWLGIGVDSDLELSPTVIDFQNGPIKEVGVNGVTNEALLAILIDRLEGAQEGPYKCSENAGALDSARFALDHLERRTRNREARGVEGTHKP